MALNYMTGNVV